MAKQTKFIALQGKAKWSHLDVPDTKYSAEGKWSIQIYLTPDSYNTVQELKKEGIRNTVKRDDEGNYVTFSRDTQKRMRGILKAFTPPKIEDKDGNVLPQNTRIGHGSDVTVTIEVYYFQTPQKSEGCAARFSSVRIDNLVPYSREDYDDKEKRAAKALDKVPAQTW